jgi:hypothetical protein
MSFLFDFGMIGNSTTYSGPTESAQLNNFNIHHIGMAFPITRWWKASAGIRPYSDVGYNIKSELSSASVGLYDYYFKGTGGLNQFHLGTSVLLFNRLSVGFNYSYLFGLIENEQSLSFPVGAGYSRSVRTERVVLGDGLLKLGLQYHENFADKYFVTLGAIYENKSELSATRNMTLQNYFPGRQASIGDSIALSPVFELEGSETEGTIVYPEKIGFGLAMGIKDKLTLSGEYEIQNWSESLVFGNTDSLVNSSTFRFGAEYTPNYQALRGYFNRVHYRLGGYYSNTYLRILGEQLPDYGITFGVGLPLRGSKSTLNLGFILGQRGTNELNLIKENYGMVQISLTMHDFWFVKRRFD